MTFKTTLLAIFVALAIKTSTLRAQQFVNVCASNPCQNNGKCTILISRWNNNVPQAYCTCTNGYSGSFCQTPPGIDACTNVQCGGGGTCVLTPSSYICICPNDSTGSSCITTSTQSTLINNSTSSDPQSSSTSSSIDFCSKCNNGGTCITSSNTFSCACMMGFYFDGTGCVQSSTPPSTQSP